MKIIKYHKLFLFISAALVLVGIVAIGVFGLNKGIDFAGGTLWQLRFGGSQPTTDVVKNFFIQNIKAKDPSVFQNTSDNSVMVKFGNISEGEHQQFLSALKEKFGNVEELRFDVIGPAIGKDLEQKAILAIVFVILGISLYVTYAFRKVSYPVKSWKYGVITLVTLFHDVIIPLGLFAILGHYLGTEIDINFVVAVLVVMGFSVHDTIVVFDRIRENLLLNRQTLDRSGLANVIGRSIDQTIARSINTSLTLILVLLAMLFLGPSSLQYFILAILVGVTVGTYSSIFVASPALLMTSRVQKSSR
ncbi:MAG: protein translocase subunit SecF [Candidatus Wolfebacteria bacterium]|nr:protein translocase subunit SecF [Candidatus Wolfebacteria bacterium]